MFCPRCGRPNSIRELPRERNGRVRYQCMRCNHKWEELRNEYDDWD